jgi:transcriptional regulator with XRE-family HTH domain
MTVPAERRLQAAFLGAILGAPGVTQAGAAAKLGVDPSVLSRWLSGERIMPFDTALWLTEWAGASGLAAAGAALGVQIDVRRPAARDAAEEPTEELIGALAGALGEHLGRLAGCLRRVAPGRPLRGGERVALLADLARLEELVRQTRLALQRA